MAKKQKEPIRYPWDEWLAKPKFTLTQGVDFCCRPDVMAGQVRNAASQYWVRVSIRTFDHHIEVKTEEIEPNE